MTTTKAVGSSSSMKTSPLLTMQRFVPEFDPDAGHIDPDGAPQADVFRAWKLYVQVKLWALLSSRDPPIYVLTLCSKK